MTDAPVKPPKAAKPKRAPKPKPAKAEPPEKLDPAAYESQGTKITMTLQPRHLEWLKNVAMMEGRTIEDMAQKLIRIAYSQDPTRGGTITPQAGSTMRAEDISKIF